MKYLLMLIPLLTFAEVIQLEPITIEEKYPYTIETFETKGFLQQTAPGMYSPVIRGLQGDLIGIELEDVKINNSNFRAGPNQYFSWIPNEFVNYNIKNGSSIGQTVDADLSSNDEISFTYDSYNNGRTYLISDSFGNTQIGVKFQETGLYNDINHTRYNQKAMFIKNTTNINEFTALYSSSKDVDRLDKFLQGKTYTYLDQDYLFLNDRLTLGNHKIGFNYQRFIENIDDNGKYIPSTNNVYGANYKYTLGLFDVHVIDSYERLSYNKENYRYNTLTTGIGFNYVSDVTVKSNVDYVRTDTSSTSLDLDFNTMTGNLEVQKGIVYGSVKYGYKMPTANNLYYANTSGKGIDIENTNLETQNAWTYTAGIKCKGTFSYDVSVFYSDIQNYIDSVKINSGVYQAQNTGDGILKGAEATFVYNDLFYSMLNMQYVYGKTDLDYMSKLIPFKMTYEISKSGAFIVWNYATDNDHLSLSDQADIRIKDDNNGYNTVDIGYRGMNNSFRYEFRLNNLTNNDGRVMGSSVDVPERSISLTAGYMF